MEFFKIGSQGLEEWKILDANPLTTDEEIAAWYRKHLKSMQDEVLADTSEKGFVFQMVKKYREEKIKQQLARQKLFKEFEEYKSSQKTE